MEMNTSKNCTTPTGKLLLIFLMFCSIVSLGQIKSAYYIQFNDKNTEFDAKLALSDKAIARRAKFNIRYGISDYPVNQSYIDQILRDTTLTLRYALKWHNAIVVETNKTSLDLSSVPFVNRVKYVGKTYSKKEATSDIPPYLKPYLKLKDGAMPTKNLTVKDYGKAYNQNAQIGAVELHKQGFDGEGIYIAVFDAGFYNIDKIPAFLRNQGNRLMTFGVDLVDFDNVITDRDNHGTAVSSCIGSYDKGRYIGSAPKANLVLFRTENAATEFPLEELNWCKAAELADSIGVDMITSSLGYTEYDEDSLSYSHSQLTGRYSYVSLAAKLAVEKGIFVLNSAGNEGDKPWTKIGTPADVPEVLTIGAVDQENTIGKFSSRGFNAAGQIKPDVCAMGVKATVASTYGSYYQGYGTSYATPIAAGGVACLMQTSPNIEPKDLATIIRQSATNNNKPDSIQGFGVARFDIAYELIKVQTSSNNIPSILKVDQSNCIIYNGNLSEVNYKIYENGKFLWIFKRKTKVYSGSLTSKQPITYIKLADFKAKCSKKYTIKINLSDGVENHALKHSDLSVCSD